MPKLSVIIVNYKSPELLKLCLKAIKEHGSDIDHEVVVIDNSIINRGFAKGVNEGLKQTSGQYRLILNPDAIITPGALQKMIAYMDAHEDIGILGPQLLYFNGDHQRSYHRFYKPATILARRTFLRKFSYFKKLNSEFMMEDTDPTKIQAPDWILGGAMFVRASAMEKVGLMDERFFLYFEDVDWCRRFWHNGYKVVYYPEVIVYHYYPRLSTTFSRTVLWHIASAVKFFLKWRTKNISKLAASS